MKGENKKENADISKSIMDRRPEYRGKTNKVDYTLPISPAPRNSFTASFAPSFAAPVSAGGGGGDNKGERAVAGAVLAEAEPTFSLLTGSGGNGGGEGVDNLMLAGDCGASIVIADLSETAFETEPDDGSGADVGSFYYTIVRESRI